MTQPITAADLVAEARAKIREITPRDFHASRGGASVADAIVIDVREPAEFERTVDGIVGVVTNEIGRAHV